MTQRRFATGFLLIAALALGVGTALSQTVLAPITIGAEPSPLLVPAAPALTLQIAQPTEVQIDAMGSPVDAQLYLYQGSELVEQDGDSGEGTDARIVRFLAPGSYDVRVAEWQGRDMTARVQAQALAPMTPVATLTPGAAPATVNAPAGDTSRAASVEITLTIATAGNYRLDASEPTGQFDPEMQLTQNNGLLQADSDSGGNRAAQIVRQLTPGEYRIRVRDWMNRATPITVTVAPQ